jgi:hypothetical protein
MAEVLVEFESTFKGPDGRFYEARACGRGRPDGLWEGWLEFTPSDGSPTVATGRETTQPKRADVVYWATGLTATYLEGALDRMLKPAPVPTRRQVRSQPAFSGPAEPILDPFRVYQEGEQMLRQQLNALAADKLRTIIGAYGLADAKTAEVANYDELVALIMTGVRRRVA